MVPSAVLDSYTLPGVTWEPVKPGFSGAAVWRGDVNGAPSFALKRWPATVSQKRLIEIHVWQWAIAKLTFVPKLIPACEGKSVVRYEGLSYEISTWRPGEADWTKPMTTGRFVAAVAALIAIHDAWGKLGTQVDICPAILRRLSLVDDYRAWLRRNPTPRPSHVPKAIDEADRRLRPWATTNVPIQTCFTDIHRDHVLYTGDAVTGVIDFGAVQPDNPAADFARLFGDDLATLDAALALSPGVNADLARDLAATAPAVNLAAWTLRLRRDGERPADPAAVALRMAGWEERLG